jgi:hypothetical protein
VLLVAAGSMPARVGCVLHSIIGLAAAGISEFQGGCAGVPVADISGILFVFLTARAGVFIDASSLYWGSWFMVVGFFYCWFLHCVTNHTVMI